MSATPRLLPASDIAERGAICSFLLAPKEVGGLCAQHNVQPAAFHNPAFGTVFNVIMDLWGGGQKLDVVVLTQTLADKNLLEQVGGAHLISELYTYLPTATNIGFYLETLDDKHTLREMIRVCTQFKERAYEEQENAKGLLQELAQAIGEIAGAGVKKDAPTFKESLMEKLERMESQTPDADMIPTGLKKLDWFSPLRRGDMPMIAGERKSGKSILALTIAINVIRNDIPTLYFSLEDRTPKVIDRIFAGASRIPVVRHTVKAMSEGELYGATKAITSLAECRLQIRDDLFDLAQITAAARLQKVKWPDLALIVVDYAQLVRSPRNKNDNREREVANVSRTLRLLAMELDCAILLLSQLNADGESRESRAIEQDCTAAWIVNKPKDEEETNSKRIISIPWQRNGESMVGFAVTFLGHLARMEDAADHEIEE